MLRVRDWEEVADFACYVCQCRALCLRPWQSPPSSVEEDDPDEHDKDAQKLLRKMLAAGVSRYDPDPLGSAEKGKVDCSQSLAAGDCMFARLKFFARLGVQSLGYAVHRLRDPLSDIRTALSPNTSPIIFDVGANIGQTIRGLRAAFPSSIIHAFEPSVEVFRELQTNVTGVKNVHLNNFAIGARPETREFIEM